MRKVLILLGFFLLCISFYFSMKSDTLPVFLMTDEPNVVSKGNYGLVFVAEVSFTHDGFEEWIPSSSSSSTLFLLHPDYIERSEKVIASLKKNGRVTSLLGRSLEEYENIDILKKDIKIYEQHFGSKPLWFMTRDYMYNEEIKQYLFSQQINMLSPSTQLNVNELPASLPEGSIVSLPLHKQSAVNFESITTFLTQHQFISIEESLFGYSLKSKRFP
ncbi:hypothetical protein [Lysinibacillus sp. 54212]|uniref:hypothetical protein n=1 Tax=Lysinibacillus sp. 54212 TaxID=3119829 RepID=UPI002FC69F18